MSLAVSFLRAASIELAEASAWYEGKQQGLAFEFMAEIERCVSQAADNPLHRPRRHPPRRRPLLPLLRVFSRRNPAYRCAGGLP